MTILIGPALFGGALRGLGGTTVGGFAEKRDADCGAALLGETGWVSGTDPAR